MTLRLRSIRELFGLGFFVGLVSTIGLATIQPGDNAKMMIFAGLGDFDLGTVLSQAVAGGQFTAPCTHLASATGLLMTSQPLGTAVITSIYSAVVNQKVTTYIPDHARKAIAAEGLTADSPPIFVEALYAARAEQAGEVHDITQAVLSSGLCALQQANADAIRHMFIIAAGFALLATVLYWWLGDVKKIMA
ncbi:uncharacterized protein A1O9_03791 [Exophiala aquamarina CBS 119918]|uniref:Major facilitator superfamily (MFS) profile domain-containing protein n=1 Tax=Exophiala aquamarina CBS 119918 TaxID=1182545 RepID=A0A072PI07_9EURO|nr:uncharacterized protein A1O9_03791 [Exophiala aquamarina CBS 119918]KEF58948.1 hypothetical protein A1O9_03791 [Exophiala aquamarina CBS 119918]